MNYTLVIRKYKLKVHLGCSADEREIPQTVLVNVEIKFSPAARESDDLHDTVCYAQICENMTKETSERPFKTVEFLGQILFDTVRKMLPSDAELTLRIRKVSPPVANLKGGIEFEVASREK